MKILNKTLNIWWNLEYFQEILGETSKEAVGSPGFEVTFPLWMVWTVFGALARRLVSMPRYPSSNPGSFDFYFFLVFVVFCCFFCFFSLFFLVFFFSFFFVSFRCFSRLLGFFVDLSMIPKVYGTSRLIFEIFKTHCTCKNWITGKWMKDSKGVARGGEAPVRAVLVRKNVYFIWFER